MTCYHILPIDKFSASFRWFTDEAGLLYVKERYTNYKKDNEIVDRWNEFEYKEVEEIPVDFGGMCMIDEPKVHVISNKTKFVVMARHLPYFIGAIQSNEDHCKNKGVCFINSHWWNVCVALETGNALIPLLLDQEKNCEEMVEGIDREFEERLNKINQDKLRIIRIHPPNDKSHQ